MSTNEFRLSGHVHPLHYKLFLTPDIPSATFSGTVTISIEITDPTSQIKLNSVDLNLERASIVSSDSTYACEIDYDKDNEMAILTTSGPLIRGEATVTIDFQGVLNDLLAGFYRSSYLDDTGATNYLACTQFEATDARRAFPCFDEPEMKAVFEVSLEVESSQFAVSNGAIASEAILPNGNKLVNFEPTIKMSTYLVAFIVGDLIATPERIVRGVPIRIIHRRGWDDLTDFAMEAASHALEFLTDYFEIPYPATKLDLIAIPDFAAGAMENLGAVTFREALLLIDAESASQPEKERIVDVVSHEIAHMWFGDLVTMKWWNGIWLNEAFATYIETLTTDHFDPNWRKWNTFGIYRATAQATDSLHSTRPIEYEVKHPSDCKGMFDILTYEKGGSVLRMLERHLGSEQFRKGIVHYLNKYLFANAETTDLWDALEEKTQEPVRALMDTWVFQGGLPLVTVTDTGNGVLLEQEPFSYVTERPDDSAIGKSWIIPISMRSIDDLESTTGVLLANSSEILPWEASGVPIANALGHGYYRVGYSNELLAQILNAFDKLVELERFNLISDTWSMVVANRATYETFTKIAQAFSDGLYLEPAGWAIIAQGVEFKAKALGEGNNSEIIELARRIFEPLFEKLGPTPQLGEPEITGVMRANVIHILGTLVRDSDVVSFAQQAFRSEISRENPLEPSLASAILHTVAVNGDEADYAFILDRFKHPESPVDEQRFLDALTAFSQSSLVDRTLSMTLDQFRSQDSPFVIAKMLRRGASGQKTFDFLIANYGAMVERFPDNTITRMLEGITGLYGPDLTARAETVRGFLATVKVPDTGKTLAQIKERYEANVELARRLRSE